MLLIILFFVAISYFFFALFQVLKRTPEETELFKKEMEKEAEYIDEAFSREWIKKEDKIGKIDKVSGDRESRENK